MLRSVVTRRAPAAVLCLALAVVAGRALAADGRVCALDDRPGEIHLSDDLPPAPATAGVALPTPPTSLAEIVERAAHRQRLDPALLHAVIRVESGGRPRAVSIRGAAGLMQLMAPTARDYGVRDRFDARENVEAGARHLRVLLDHFGQDISLALAAYNAGAAAVERRGTGRPNATPNATPNAETAAYVPRVLGLYAALQRRGGGSGPAPAPETNPDTRP